MSQSRWLQWSRLVFHSGSFPVIVALILLHPYQLSAFELSRAEVSENNGVYLIQLTAVFDTPAEYISQVLTDYAHIYRLSSSIIESEVLPSSQADTTRIRTRMLACASIFCREIERVDAIRKLTNGELQAEIVPELSEFRSGQATWKINALDDRSEIVYQATIEPDFYIPPVIGVSVISSTLKDEYLASFERLETIASINAEREWSEDFAVSGVIIDSSSIPCSSQFNAGL